MQFRTFLWKVQNTRLHWTLSFFWHKNQWFEFYVEKSPKHAKNWHFALKRCISAIWVNLSCMHVVASLLGSVQFPQPSTKANTCANWLTCIMKTWDASAIKCYCLAWNRCVVRVLLKLLWIITAVTQRFRVFWRLEKYPCSAAAP